jgi:hypothetical protein
MQVHVEEQRATDPHVTLSRDNDRQYIFVSYEHTITSLEAAEGLEWWFPYANGGAYRAVIHGATLEHGLNIIGPATQLSLYVQSPNESVRIKIHDFGKLPQEEELTHTYVVPAGARGILVIIGAQLGDIFKASYLVEQRR